MFTGCTTGKTADTANSNLDPSPYIASKQNKDVNLSIKENKITVDTNEITLIFENKTDTLYLYGEITYLEVESDGIWYSIPSKENVAWTMVAYPLSANSLKELVFPIHTYFDNLESGKYRIVKKISISDDPQNVSFVIAEFVVE
jgi:hypothetical protein